MREEGDTDGEHSALSLLNLGAKEVELPRTLKFEGKVHELHLFILINSEASHNIISKRLVEAMGWPWETIIDGRWAQVKNVWSLS